MRDYSWAFNTVAGTKLRTIVDAGLQLFSPKTRRRLFNKRMRGIRFSLRKLRSHYLARLIPDDSTQVYELVLNRKRKSVQAFVDGVELAANSCKPFRSELSRRDRYRLMEGLAGISHDSFEAHSVAGPRNAVLV